MSHTARNSRSLCAALAAMLPVFVANGDEWQMRVRTTQDSYAVLEPVVLLIEFRNQEATPREVRFPTPCTSIVSDENGAQHTLTLHEPVAVESGAEHRATARLVKPGESTTFTLPILIGSDDDSISQLVFSRPGRWKLELPGRGVKTAVTIKALETQDDLRAARIITPRLAAVIQGHVDLEDDDWERVEEICKDCPASRFFPVYAMALVDRAIRQWDGELDYERLLALLKTLLEKHPQSPLRDDAIYTMFTVQSWKDGQSVADEELLKQFQKQYPDSPAIDRIRQESLSFFGSESPSLNQEPENPVAKQADVAGLRLSGSDKIPDGAKQSIFGYWESVVKEDVVSAVMYLADDFQGERCDKQQLSERLQRSAANFNLEEFEVNILEAQQVKEYSRPAGKFDSGVLKLAGDIVLVSSTYTSTETALATGRKSTSGPVTSTMALMQRDGKWQIVSEVASTANSRASLLARDITTALQGDFGAARVVFRGKHETVRSLLAAEKLAGPESTLTWVPAGSTFEGKHHDAVTIQGELAVADGDRASRFRLTMGFALKGEELEMISFKHAPVATGGE